MIGRTFYMVAEVEHADDGRVLPKRYVSGPYGEYLLAKQVSAELGDGYHVFQATDFDDEVQS
ncbi:hypothetical protein [Salinisphaera orenii]|uniref:Uncharacterized protein n=1 Tax=Salinisphaera orenii YIM 95161 TaxID=1051139 RepID=A0A423PME5_9GAMM|nr:hypothetical protein [Salinisphaera halophila]ROO26773.1 hypothetical protein SAHL_12215 [Salinisphaera halophila YIM 95161]